MRRFFNLLLPAVLSGVAAHAAAQPPGVTGRGELLYTTHCVECHNARVHWRDEKLATSWKTLVAQVRRWQAVQKLDWSEPDIVEVARYLNRFYYEFPMPAAPLRTRYAPR